MGAGQLFAALGLISCDVEPLHWGGVSIYALSACFGVGSPID